ncbi:MAG TPA: hypothetical protein VHC97_14615 [Thermoanaerobaculia bacterium]|nr:hypothetical protein [Thermoanaerobaculia bacterium]
MQTRDLDRIRFFTRYFNDLQGLRHWVPLGLLTLGAGVAASHLVSRLLAAPLFLGALLLTFGARRFLGVWLRRERRLSQRHYLALGAVLMGLAALGAFLGYLVDEDAENAVRIINFVLPVVVRPWMALLVCGASTVLAGLLDHWQLVRALGWSCEEE